MLRRADIHEVVHVVSHADSHVPGAGHGPLHCCQLYRSLLSRSQRKLWMPIEWQPYRDVLFPVRLDWQKPSLRCMKGDVIYSLVEGGIIGIWVCVTARSTLDSVPQSVRYVCTWRS